MTTSASRDVAQQGGSVVPPGPLPEQDRLRDFWLPQRGVFAVGEASFAICDPTRHRPADAGRITQITGGLR